MRGLVLAILVLLGLPSAAAAALPGNADVDRSPATGSVTFVGTDPGETLARPAGVTAADSAGTGAREFLEANAGDFGLGAGASLSVESREPVSKTDDAVRVAQSVDGVQVMGGEFVVQLNDSNRVLSVLGEAEPAAHVDTTPSVTRAAAETTAIAAVAKSESASTAMLDASDTQLAIFDARIMGGGGPERATLVWTTVITDPAGTISQLAVVDANVGNVVTSIEQIQTAKTRTVCDGANTTAQVPCTSPVLSEGGSYGGSTPDVTTAYDYAGDTYDFYKTRFGRDSLDGAGLPLKSTVRHCEAGEPCPYTNAFWNGRQMAYGDGFATADDVVGHELTHGVTQFTSHLFDYAQAGAINESLSDVFGELIDQVSPSPNDTAADRWKLGESLPIGVLRDMKNPPAFSDPDKLTSSLWRTTAADSYGVHTNSGVNNKAAYLITDGDTFNGQTVTGLGLDKAARLYYAVETSFLTSASDYQDLGNALHQACLNLVGSDGFVAADCDQVDKVVLATEMADDTRAPETPKCESGSPTGTLFSDDLENPASGNWVRTGTQWYYPQNPNPVFDATYATSGTKNFWGDDAGTTSDSSIAMTASVAVPANAYLWFRHSYGFEDTSGPSYWDGGVIESSTDGGTTWQNLADTPYNGTIKAGGSNPLQGRPGFVADSRGYVSTRVSLAALAGQSARLRFRIGTDAGGDDYGWFIDDIDVHTCAGGGSAPDTTVDTGPADGSTTNDNTPTFTMSATPPAGATFECKVDGGSFGACASPYTTATLPEGSHTVQIRATSGGIPDPTPAQRTFTVDTVPPDTTITGGPAAGSTTSATTPGFTMTATEPGSSFECKLDGSAFATCTSPYTTPTLSDGSHTVEIRAVDAAGNVDPTPAARTFTVEPDVTPPDTTISSGPAEGATVATATATFTMTSSEALSTFECSVDGGAFSACSSPYTTPALTNGAHTVQIQAKDDAGNVDPTPESRTFTVAVTPGGGGGGGGGGAGGGGAVAPTPTVTPPTVAPPTPDPIAPAVSVTKVKGSRTKVKLTVAATVPGAARITGKARLGNKRKGGTGKGRATLFAGVPATVKLRLSRKLQRRLRNQAVKITFTVTLAPADGSPAVKATKRVKLKRKRR